MKLRIWGLREDSNLTQKEVVNYLGISQRGYSHYKLGNNSLPIEHLIKLAKIYNTITDYILGLTKIKKNNNNLN